MYTFTALIYDGYKQQLVSGKYESNDQFDAFLTQRFGVYVCMWRSQELTAHLVNSPEGGALINENAHVLNVQPQ